MSKEKPKPYTYVVIASIVVITGLSMAALALMSSNANIKSTRYAEIVDNLNNYADLARDDIEVILSEDSAKFETSISILNELYYLKDKYRSMFTHNLTNPGDYSPLDFEEVLIEFTYKMRLIISAVNQTSVYEYSAENIGATVANNFTYLGIKDYFISNQWYVWLDTFLFLHNDIRDYVTASFSLSGDPLVVP